MKAQKPNRPVLFYMLMLAAIAGVFMAASSARAAGDLFYFKNESTDPVYFWQQWDTAPTEVFNGPVLPGQTIEVTYYKLQAFAVTPEADFGGGVLFSANDHPVDIPELGTSPYGPADGNEPAGFVWQNPGWVYYEPGEWTGGATVYGPKDWAWSGFSAAWALLIAVMLWGIVLRVYRRLGDANPDL